MADIRCPMCSKLNPDHLDVCQYCQARLKPLVISPTGEGESPPDKRTPAPQSPPESETSLPDWLDSMRSEDTGEELEEQEADFEEGEPDSEDWLDRIRAVTAEEQAPFRETPFTGEKETPSEVEEEDWLQRIREMHAADQQPEEPEETGLDESSQDVLARIRAFQSLEDKSATPEEPQEEDAPDWMTILPPSEEPPFSEPDEEFEGDEGTPDWLSDLQIERVSQPAEIQDIPAEPGEEDLPDWSLGGDEEEAEPAIKVEAEIPPAIPAEELPAWVSEVATPEEISTAPEEEEEAPDWLADFEAPETSPPEEPPAPPDDVGEAETPDWFSELEDAEPSITVEPESPPSEPEEDEIPDWLSDLDASEPLSTIEPVSPPEEPEEDEALDWLSEIAESEELALTETTLSGEEQLVTEGDEDLPDWLTSLKTDALDTEIEADALEIDILGEPAGDEDILSDEDLPSWLTEEADEQLISDEAPAAEAAETPEITPAELPTWLQAMRPVDTPDEAPIPPEDEGEVESAGPLAGLRGVLSAEPEIARLKKPPAYAIKLQVSESQRKHASLLEELLASEGQTQPIPRPPLVSSQRVLRWIISLILVLVVGIVVVAGSQQVPLPDPALIPPEVLNTRRVIDELPSQAPALVAFDYQPGLSGEMDAAVASVLDHLMEKGARLALVSTSSTGPALAEHFLATAQAEHAYVSGEHYINLGYVPGGASGLLGFSERPARVTPLSFDGLDAWATKPLQGVGSLADFGLVLIVTDNPDIARTWIEQVQPKLADTPLVIVTSAQADPLVRPYYEESPARVHGLVSGIAGGAAYEQITGQANLVRSYWDAFSVGLILSVAAILIGGAANIASSLLSSSLETEKEPEEETQ
jgi:hypothetical protein